MRLSEILSGALLIAGGVAAMRKVREHEREARRRELATQEGNEPGEPSGLRFVVVGCGFAGLSAVNHLTDRIGDDANSDILLIDRHNYHLFYPLLYQVATGGLEAGALAYPIRVTARHRGFRYLEANVENVDLTAKRLETDAGPIPYDQLILAPGSTSNFFGMKDAAEHAIPLKSIRDGIRLRDRVIETFELAEQEPDPDRRRALLTYALVGGGATGVELVSSLADMLYTSLLPNYPGINPADVRLVLVESHETVLNGWSSAVQQIAMGKLRSRGVRLVLGTTVIRVSDNGVETRDGQRIPTATVVWTAGVKAPPLIDKLPGSRERDGRIHVNEHLELPDYPGVFVAGDAAFYVNPTTGKAVPPTAEAALSEGQAAAENAVRRARGVALETYVFHSKGELVSLGRGAAAANLFGVVLDGLLAWIVRRGVYLVNLVGFRNRLLVVVDWAFVSFHRRVIASFDSITSARQKVAIPAGKPAPALEKGASSEVNPSASAPTKAPVASATSQPREGASRENATRSSSKEERPSAKAGGRSSHGRGGKD